MTTIYPVDLPPRDSLPSSLVQQIEKIVATAVPSDAPRFVHTLGGPGSGKTSLLAALQEHLIDYQPVFVAMDQLMEAMPEYQAEADLARAFMLHELPARMACYTLLKDLIAKKANIVFEHSGAHDAHPGLLRYAKQSGYTIALYHVQATAVAQLGRITRRHTAGGRYVPADYVAERHALLTSLLPHYRAVADRYHVIDNSADADDPVTALRGYLNNQ